MFRRDRNSYFAAERPRVEVIPMIDIMMFLLVFFVVLSINMIAGTGLDMNLPGSKMTQDRRVNDHGRRKKRQSIHCGW